MHSLLFCSLHGVPLACVLNEYRTVALCPLNEFDRRIPNPE